MSSSFCCLTMASPTDADQHFLTSRDMMMMTFPHSSRNTKHRRGAVSSIANSNHGQSHECRTRPHRKSLRSFTRTSSSCDSVRSHDGSRTTNTISNRRRLLRRSRQWLYVVSSCYVLFNNNSKNSNGIVQAQSLSEESSVTTGFHTSPCLHSGNFNNNNNNNTEDNPEVLMGYSTLESLRLDLYNNDTTFPHDNNNNNNNNNNIQVFTLCPMTNFTFQEYDDPLVLSTSVILQCGMNGYRTDNCILERLIKPTTTHEEEDDDGMNRPEDDPHAPTSTNTTKQQPSCLLHIQSSQYIQVRIQGLTFQDNTPTIIMDDDNSNNTTTSTTTTTTPLPPLLENQPSNDPPLSNDSQHSKNPTAIVHIETTDQLGKSSTVEFIDCAWHTLHSNHGEPLVMTNSWGNGSPDTTTTTTTPTTTTISPSPTVTAIPTTVFLSNETLGASESPSSTPSSNVQEPQPQVPLVLSLTFDGFPGETAWKLYCGNDDDQIMIMQRPLNYYDGNPFLTVDELLLVPQGSTCTLTVQDGFGDGMCCQQGDGSYTLYYGDETVVSDPNFVLLEGGVFGTEDEQTFVVEMPSMSLSQRKTTERTLEDVVVVGLDDDDDTNTDDNILPISETPSVTPEIVELTTTFEGLSGNFGIMFDITATSEGHPKTLDIQSLDMHANIVQPICPVRVYTKTGSHQGFETSLLAWTKLVDATISCNGFGERSPIPSTLFTQSIQLESGDTQAFLIVMGTVEPALRYTDGTGLGLVYAQDDYLQIKEGQGFATFPVSQTFEPRVWNGVIVYKYIPGPPTLMPSVSLEPTWSPTVTPLPTITGIPTQSMFPTTSSMPTMSAMPSGQPTITGEPTISEAPTVTASLVPTVTAAPSISSPPSMVPTITARPSLSSVPSQHPSVQPTVTATPTLSVHPSAVPTVTGQPTLSIAPSVNPSHQPTITGVPSSSPHPSTMPTVTGQPTISMAPSVTPSHLPTMTGVPSSSPHPSIMPTVTGQPTISISPSVNPSSLPTMTGVPSSSPHPSMVPTVTAHPSVSMAPSQHPSILPTITAAPTNSVHPSMVPTVTAQPTISMAPSQLPSILPTVTASPTNSVHPSMVPTVTARPSISMAPSHSPSILPTATAAPTNSVHPSMVPTVTGQPTISIAPSQHPSILPTITATPTNSVHPSIIPTVTARPSNSIAPSHSPSILPTVTAAPTNSINPSMVPTVTARPSISIAPSQHPSMLPTITAAPTNSVHPSMVPTVTARPSISIAPSQHPSILPTVTAAPTNSIHPSMVPTVTAQPSESNMPSGGPSSQPTITASPSNSVQPSMVPTITAGPSVSHSPSILPSLNPTQTPLPSLSSPPSQMPTITGQPSSSAHPTSVPSLYPTTTPLPSLSMVPTVPPEPCSTVLACEEQGYFCNHDSDTTNDDGGFCESCGILATGTDHDDDDDDDDVEGRCTTQLGLSLSQSIMDCVASCTRMPTNVIVHQCLFQNNVVAGSSVVVHASRGDLNITETDFFTNQVLEGKDDDGSSSSRTIVDIQKGALVLTNTSFAQNEVPLTSPGLVLVGVDGSITTNDNNCGIENNVSNAECQSIQSYIQGFFSFSGICSPFDYDAMDSSNCRLPPSPVVNFNPTAGCFSDWNTLVAHVDAYSAFATGGIDTAGSPFVLTICPNTIFDLGTNHTTHDNDNNNTETLPPPPHHQPLIIRTSNTMLQCGDNSEASDDNSTISAKSDNTTNHCLLVGGESQIRVEGSVTGVVIEGLTFKGTTQNSAIHILPGDDDIGESSSGSSSPDIEIRNCEFSEHEGMAVLMIGSFSWFDDQGDDTMESSGDQGDDTMESSGEQGDDTMESSGEQGDDTMEFLGKQDLENATTTMTISITSCLFTGNRVQVSPVTYITNGGSLIVDNTVFLGNSKGTAGGISFSGSSTSSISVSNSCFIRNSGYYVGAIDVYDGSSVIDLESNFGKENEGNTSEADSCDDIWFEAEQGICEEFDSSNCPSSIDFVDPLGNSGKCQFNSLVDGYSDAMSLLNDLRDEISEVFYLCPGTILTEEMEIILDHASFNFSFVCADKRRGCIFDTLTRHLVLRADDTYPNASATEQPLTISFEGITFRNASDVSVVLEGFQNSPLDVIFTDCRWEDNNGTSILVINPPDDTGTPEEIETSPPSTTMETPDMPVDDMGRKLQDSPTFSIDVKLYECVFSRNIARESLFSNYNGKLVVDSCSFRQNDAEGSILATIGGSVSVNDARFEQNTYNKSQGVIFVDSTTIISPASTEACGLANYATPLSSLRDFSCGGIFVKSTGPCEVVEGSLANGCEGTCYELNECLLNCFSDYSGLADALDEAANAGTGGIFRVCPGTVFNLDKEGGPIRIRSSNTTLQCGDDGSARDNCVIQGGMEQLVLSGEVSGVHIQGMIMEGARDVSVTIQGVSPLAVLFSECVWMDIFGASAVIIRHGLSAPPFSSSGGMESTIAPTEMTEADDDLDMFEDFDEIFKFRYGGKVDNDAPSLVLYKCFFESNNLTGSMVVNEGAYVDIDSCLFIDNDVEKAFVSNENGEALIASSCFRGNKHASDGLIVSDNSSELFASGVYGAENYFNGGVTGCSGISSFAGDCESNMTGPCSAACSAFDSAECLALDIAVSVVTLSAVEAPPDVCFSDWKNLSIAVTNAPSGSVLTICPFSFLDASGQPESMTPIVINQKDLTIQCGEDGRRLSKCTIFGGDSQFVIRSIESGTIHFRGLLMTSSTTASVLAFGDSDMDAVFDDCEWKSHNGKAVVVVYNGEEGFDALNQLETLPAPSKASMVVDFKNSMFMANEVSFSSVAIIGGTALFNKTVFLQNTDSAYGVIRASGDASVSLRSSCFISNRGSLPGAVFIESSSSLMANFDTFGRGNVASDGTCTAVFQESTGSSCTLLQRQTELTCDGTCSPFTATTCAVPLEVVFEGTQPSSSPTTTPSPTLTTSTQPSLDAIEEDPFELSTLSKASLGSSSIFIRTLVMGICFLLAGVIGYVFLDRRERSGRQSTGLEGEGEHGSLGEALSETNEASSGNQHTPFLSGFRRKSNGSDIRDLDDNDGYNNVGSSSGEGGGRGGWMAALSVSRFKNVGDDVNMEDEEGMDDEDDDDDGYDDDGLPMAKANDSGGNSSGTPWMSTLAFAKFRKGTKKAKNADALRESEAFHEPYEAGSAVDYDMNSERLPGDRTASMGFSMRAGHMDPTVEENAEDLRESIDNGGIQDDNHNHHDHDDSSYDDEDVRESLLEQDYEYGGR